MIRTILFSGLLGLGLALGGCASGPADGGGHASHEHDEGGEAMACSCPADCTCGHCAAGGGADAPACECGA